MPILEIAPKIPKRIVLSQELLFDEGTDWEIVNGDLKITLEPGDVSECGALSVKGYEEDLSIMFSTFGFSSRQGLDLDSDMQYVPQEPVQNPIDYNSLTESLVFTREIRLITEPFAEGLTYQQVKNLSFTLIEDEEFHDQTYTPKFRGRQRGFFRNDRRTGATDLVDVYGILIRYHSIVWTNDADGGEEFFNEAELTVDLGGGVIYQ